MSDSPNPRRRRDLREGEPTTASAQAPDASAVGPVVEAPASPVSPPTTGSTPVWAPPPRTDAIPVRGGRNIWVASLVGIALLALIVGALYLSPWVFVALVVVVCCGALWELQRAFSKGNLHLPLPPLLVGATGILLSGYLAGVEAMWVALLITGGAVVAWRTFEGGGLRALRDGAAGVFAAVYVPFLAGFVLVSLANPTGGPARVLMLVIVVSAADTGGYLAGMALGRHKLAPRVSPNKTWEGLAGSFLLSCAAGSVAMHFLLGQPWWQGAVVGFLGTVAAFVGDLGESLLKRDLDVKDMGHLLPGHGGILDRLDSLLIASPVVYLSLTLLLP